ncbi:Unknown protein, partial [Striga hermonthica]
GLFSIFRLGMPRGHIHLTWLSTMTRNKKSKLVPQVLGGDIFGPKRIHKILNNPATCVPRGIPGRKIEKCPTFDYFSKVAGLLIFFEFRWDKKCHPLMP